MKAITPCNRPNLVPHAELKLLLAYFNRNQLIIIAMLNYFLYWQLSSILNLHFLIGKETAIAHVLHAIWYTTYYSLIVLIIGFAYA